MCGWYIAGTRGTFTDVETEAGQGSESTAREWQCRDRAQVSLTETNPLLATWCGP
jgi:hypothetical protein